MYGNGEIKVNMVRVAIVILVLVSNKKRNKVKLTVCT